MEAASNNSIVQEIILRLRMEADPGNAKIAEQTARAGITSQTRLTETVQKSAKEQASAVEKLQRAESDVSAKRQAANEKYRSSTKQALEGITSLARGLTLIGVASEKDLEKAVRVLAKFEAGAQVLKGTITIIEAGTNAWKAYRTAVLAAAAAEAARGAVAGAAGAGGGAAGGAVGGAAAGAAGAAGVGLGGRLIGGAALAARAVGGAFAATGPVGYAIAAVATAKLTSELNSMSEAMEAAEKSAKRLAEYEQRISEQREQGDSAVGQFLGHQGALFPLGLEEARARGGRGLRGTDRDAAANQAGLNRSQSELAGIRSQQRSLADNGAEGLVGPAGRFASFAQAQQQLAQQERTALEQVKQLEQERLGINQRIVEQKIKGTQEARDSLKVLQDQARAESQGLAQSVEDAAARFGRLSPQDQRRTLSAKKALDEGQDLTRGQRGLLDSLGLESLTAATRQQDIADAIKAGFESAGLGRAEEDRAADLGQRALEIGFQIQSQNELVIKLENDATKLADDLGERLRPIFREMAKTIVVEAEARLKQEVEQQARNKNAQLARP
ncbi:MAG: hypothetical protein WD894_04970 [Pirellulales bacterium]